jgi:adenosylhomocysteine nucleosidase
VPTVALLAPMVPEFKPVVRALSLTAGEPVGTLRSHRGRVGAIEVVAVVTGIGTAAARSVTEQVLDALGPDYVVVVGVAGGLSPTVRVGDLVIPAAAVDRETRAEYTPASFGDAPRAGKVATGDRLEIGDDEKRWLLDHGVVAVDMETSAVAAVCQGRGVPWAAFRGISDRADDGSVDQAVANLSKPDGTANVQALVKFAVTHPGRLTQLNKLAKGFRAAIDAAAGATEAAIRGLSG